MHVVLVFKDRISSFYDSGWSDAHYVAQADLKPVVLLSSEIAGVCRHTNLSLCSYKVFPSCVCFPSS